MPTDEQERTIRAAVDWFLGKKRIFAVSRADLTQQARLVTLETARREPEKSKNPGYMFKALRRQLGNTISRELSVVSISGRWELGKTFRRRVPVEEARSLQALGGSPEVQLLAEEEQRLHQRWRIQFRRALDRAVIGLPPPASEIVDRKFGLDGLPPENDNAIADRLGVPVKDVYRTWEKAMRRVRDDLDFHLLERRLQELRKW